MTDVEKTGEVLSLAIQDEAKDATIEFDPDDGTPVVALKLTNKSDSSYNAMVTLTAMALQLGGPGIPHVHFVRYDISSKEIREIRFHR